jgi:hypothetical protein
MSLEDLAKRLTDPARVGMTPDVAEKLGLGDADVTRARLMAQIEDDGGHLGVYMLACYVVDDTDFWGDGEIYWWSIPVLADAQGQVTTNPLHGLPNGMPPHKCGSLEWMTNLSLAEPPLLAVIPPDSSIATCQIRLAIYDDDGKPADLPAAMTAGLDAYASVAKGAHNGADNIVAPVRSAIWNGLRADQDDILIDQDVTLRRGESVNFHRGMIGSIVNAMARVYYFVNDESKTERFGPVNLHKGQMETVKFDSTLKGGGRLALFSRGATVSCSTFGDLDTDTPFANKIIDERHEASLAAGFNVVGSGPAKFVAFYTPPA